MKIYFAAFGSDRIGLFKTFEVAESSILVL